MPETQLTTEELAQRLRLKIPTIWKLCRERRIPHRRINRSIRFDAAEIERWLQLRSR
jgi:excisionase family DNA binding protein